MGKSKLTLYIFIALVAGVVFGWLAPDLAVMTKPFADVFLRMIKMIIAPLLFATLVVGIAGHGSIKSLGKIGAKTIIYFEVVTTIALFIGLGFANYFKPGAGLTLDISKAGTAAFSQIQANAAQMSGHGHSVSDTFVNMVPTSIIQAMATGDILQVVVFAIFFALAICAVGEKAKPIMDGLNSLAEIMFKFTEYVMIFAPMGVFAAIATTVGQNGIGVLGVYVKLVGVLYAALALFVAVVLFAACKIVKIPFLGLVGAIKDPALLAFSTA
ncbi:MAG: cation:dicarboxylase symporter family transporter, partial [Candidatus Gastranaerophilales bacterium]|nr:cation:dicarboxylase symporter family transporter [Candidatus Gastranaerophilales bacterium]